MSNYDYNVKLDSLIMLRVNVTFFFRTVVLVESLSTEDDNDTDNDRTYCHRFRYRCGISSLSMETRRGL